jgi:hypothetical protein
MPASADPAFYVELGGSDPSAEFLVRFADRRPPVRPMSRRGAGPGVEISVSDVHVLSRTTAEVWAGYWVGPLKFDSYVYRLKRYGPTWVVTDILDGVMG